MPFGVIQQVNALVCEDGLSDREIHGCSEDRLKGLVGSQQPEHCRQRGEASFNGVCWLGWHRFCRPGVGTTWTSGPSAVWNTGRPANMAAGSVKNGWRAPALSLIGRQANVLTPPSLETLHAILEESDRILPCHARLKDTSHLGTSGSCKTSPVRLLHFLRIDETLPSILPGQLPPHCCHRINGKITDRQSRC